LKDIVFPANKKRIIEFTEQQAVNNPKCYEILPVIQSIDEEKDYCNVFEVTKAAGLVK